MARRDRVMHTNPFAGQRVVRVHEMAAAFPVERLRGLGATDDELNAAKVAWDTLTPEQQAQSAAMMAEQTDDDLRDMIAADRMAASDEVLQSIVAWAEHAVAAGTYPDADHALDALDDWAEAVEDELQPLVGVPTPPEAPEAEPDEAEPEVPTPADGSGTVGAQSEAPADGPPEAGAEPATDDPYPADGSVSDVLNWVSRGEDMTARAGHAIDQEGTRAAGPRKGVTDPLTKIVGSAD
jgi:hypothetical protein